MKANKRLGFFLCCISAAIVLSFVAGIINYFIWVSLLTQ